MPIGVPHDLAAHANANPISGLTRTLTGLRHQPGHAVRLTDGRRELCSVGRTKTNSNKQIGRKSKNQKTNDEMKREVRNALGAIRELLSVSDAQEANAKYKVGRQVLAVQTKYGKRAVKMLIEELGYGKDVLYNAARVVKTWDEPAFAKLLQSKGAKEMSLSFSHFVKLSQEERQEVRAALVRKVLEEGLSVDETAALVKLHRVKSGSRRKQSLHRVVTRLEMSSQKLAKKAEEVITELKKEETVAPETVSSLRNMAKLLGDAGAHCASVADQHGATSKPALKQAEADAQSSEPQEEQPRSEERTQPSEPQQEQPQPEEQLSSSHEPTAGFLHVQKIDDPAEPPIVAPATKIQGD